MDTQLAEIVAAVARVEVGVEGLNEKVDDIRDTAVKRLDDHAGRIRSLELARSRLKGVAAAVVAVAGSAIAYWKS